MNKQPIDYIAWSQEYFNEVKIIEEKKQEIKSSDINPYEKRTRILILNRLIRELTSIAYLLKSRGERYM